MSKCEQMVLDLTYLEAQGMSQFRLNLMHHSKHTEITYAGSIKYWLKGHNPIAGSDNDNHVSRIRYVAKGYANKDGRLSDLIREALKQWPLR